MSDLLKSLNSQQLEAVTAPLGPVLVLAGAGSGKTRALTYRIAYLIQTKTFLPSQILAVTFTNKAASEMKERIEYLIQSQTAREKTAIEKNNTPTLGTFHSICARPLRKEIRHLPPFTPAFTIFDRDDSLRALKQIIKDTTLEREITPTYARALISSIKNQQIKLSAVENEDIVRLFEAYQRLLMELNALDFDDLLLQAVNVFKEQPKVLEKYQRIWQYILVDEYQDTNNIQYQLIKMLIGENQNIFAVGDDAQSIYGFRGANYKNILDFENDFPDATVVTLDENYRSTQNILSAANEVIKLSAAQKKKNLWTKNASGEKIVHYTGIDEVAEAMFVAGEVMKLSSKNESSNNEPQYVPEEDVAISETPFFDMMLKKAAHKRPLRHHRVGQELDSEKLRAIVVPYRTNAQSRVLEEVFLQFGIPYHLVGAVRFYERKEIKDILSYLRLIQNPKDNFSLSRAINIPPRGIGEKSFELIRMGDADKLSARARGSWDDFQTKLESIRAAKAEQTLVDALDITVKKFNLEEFYRDGTSEGEDRWENVKELYSVAGRFNHLPWNEGLAAFLEEIALYSETDEVGNKSGVTLMTLHQAKGLEFDTVFMVGLEEGLLPHMKSLEPGEDVNEEIRLAYVGMTRARKNLYLLNAHTRRIFGATYNLKPSRILRAVPDELIHKKDGWE